MPRYRVDLAHMFRFARELSRYDSRFKAEEYQPGAEMVFDYDGPIEDARDSLVDILAVAVSEALEPVEDLQRT